MEVFCCNAAAMLTLEQMIKIDPELGKLPKPELEAIRDALYEHAQLAFDVYWEKKRGSKNPVRLLPPPATAE